MSMEPHDIRPSWWHDVFTQCAQLRYLHERSTSSDLRLRCNLLAASVQPGERAKVAIVTSCIDGATSNPLTWCALCTEFPALQFDLFVLTPDDPNHHFVPVKHAASVTPWAIYSVDLLAALYPPVHNELGDIIQPVPYDVGLRYVEDLSSKLMDRDASLTTHLQDSFEDVGHCKVAGKVFGNVVEGEGAVARDSVEVGDSAKGVCKVDQGVE